MKEDRKFEVIKDIPIKGGNGKISKGTLITRIHGVYYMEGGMLSRDYQEDFDDLIETESQMGWKYICPLKDKVAFGNNKEEI